MIPLIQIAPPDGIDARAVAQAAFAIADAEHEAALEGRSSSSIDVQRIAERYGIAETHFALCIRGEQMLMQARAIIETRSLVRRLNGERP